MHELTEFIKSVWDVTRGFVFVIAIMTVFGLGYKILEKLDLL